jgi:hypothetical protein
MAPRNGRGLWLMLMLIGAPIVGLVVGVFAMVGRVIG